MTLLVTAPTAAAKKGKEHLSALDLKWHDRQLLAFWTRATELLFGGASEGGKSTMVRLGTTVWSAHILNLQTFIFRKYYNDVVTNHMDGPTSYPVLLKPWIKDGIVRLTEDNVWFEQTNANISLRQLRTEEDLEKNQGIEKHVFVADEATQLKQRHLSELRAWVRMPLEMRQLLPDQIGHLYPHIPREKVCELFPRIIHTANPIGQSVGYFRRQFVKPRQEFEIERASDDEGGFLRQYIPSRIDDNPSADKAAQARRLAGLGKARAAALIEGTWDAPTGDYFKEYDDDAHSVPDFIPPPDWFKYRTFDWGTSDPFCFYWWCVSDGKSFTDQKGRERWFPRGALICYREWYGCDPKKPEEGLTLRNEEMARGAVVKTPEMVTAGWSNITLCDSFPFSDRGLDRAGKIWRIADTFAEHGCPLLKANTARITGWSMVRDRLIGFSTGETDEAGELVRVPMIYFCHSCVYVREYMPALPYSETNDEDAAESGEATHSCDCVRYACAARPLVLEQKLTLAASPPPGIISVAPIISQISKPPSRPRLK